MRECAALEEEFRAYSDEMEELRGVFDAAWDDQIQRVYAEQEVFQSQVCVCGVHVDTLHYKYHNIYHYHHRR